MKELRNSLRRLLMGNLVAAMILTTIPVSAYGAQSVSAGADEVLADESILMEGSEEVLPDTEEEVPVIDREESEPVIDETPDTLEPEADPIDTDSENPLPKTSCTYSLDRDVTIYDAWVVSGANITLDLNGHTIKRIVQSNGDGTEVIQIKNGGSLTLNDSVGTGTITSDGNGSFNFARSGGGVHIFEGGSFTMNAGKITGNRALFGGGVFVGNGGSFTMTDGEICDNEAFDEGGESGFGGGVYVEGLDKSASFTMTGGSIHDNSSSVFGGGVHVAGNNYIGKASFKMAGGEIKGNTALYGGGVSAEGNVDITFSNGIIEGNTASDNGGGAFLREFYNTDGEMHYLYPSFDMTGGKISGNTARGYGGGGVYASESTFSMGGRAVIMENKALGESYIGSYGGGVCAWNSTFTMSGNAVVVDNTATCGGGIDVEDKTDFSMTDDARVEGNRATGTHQLGGGVRVHDSTFEMSGNAMITGNETDNAGGGLQAENSKVYMKGGSITGNKAGMGGGVDVVRAENGADSSFYMTGGTISRNTASYGGGLYVNNSLLDMTGGSVKSNTSKEIAGGVYVTKGSFLLKGGSIENNSGTYGGGIRFKDSTLNMSGGEIKGNLATSGGGGGVYAEKDSIFTVSGGSIKGNSSKNYWSGGVYYDKETRFTVSGDPVIYDNYNGGTLSADGLYHGGNRADIHTGNKNDAYKVVKVIGELTDGAKIGLCGECGVAVAEGDNGYTLTESDKAKFVSDYSDNGRYWDMELADGKLYMGMPISFITVSPDQIPDQTYTGSPLKPDFKVMDGETELEKDVQYSLSYTDNTEVGTATVTITGKKKAPDGPSKMYYVGSKSVTFNIVQAGFTDTDIKKEPKYGEADSIDLSRFYKSGVSVNAMHVDDGDHIFESCALTDKVLRFKIKNDFKLTGKTAVITIPVSGGKNYKACTIKITVTVIPDENYRELVDDIKKEEGNKNTVVSSNTTGNSEGGTDTTITVGGQEVSKVTVDKNGKITEKTQIWVSGIEKSYKYTGEAVKPEIHVYDGTKKLTEGTDYSVGYSSNKAAGSDTAKIKISFKGSYAGTAAQTVKFTIEEADLATDVTVTDATVAEGKKAQKPVPVITMKATGKKLAASLFEYKYSGTVKTKGDYTVEITPKKNNKNFKGKVTAKVTVTDSTILLFKASVKLADGKPKTITYTGSEIPVDNERYILTIKNGKDAVTLKAGVDYDVTYTNNVNPGSVLVTFTGKDKYKGTKTTTFKIVKGRSIKDAAIRFSYVHKVPYAKGGAKPEITVKDGEKVLTLGKDYTISYTGNKAVTEGETATAKVKGKGNYKDFVLLTFEVTGQDIKTISNNIVVNDKIKSNKEDGYKNPSVVITDLDGKKLKLNKDYEIPDEYTGPDAKGYVTVTIKGKGNYSGTCKMMYRYIDADKNIGKAKARTKITAKSYTGKAIYIEDEELNKTLAAGETPLERGKHFEVVSYENNVKKGTAKILLKGIGEYGGTRTLTFKITAKTGTYKGALKGGEWK